MSLRYRYRTRLHMSPEKAEEIRRRYWAREKSQRELGLEYQLHQASISRIICGLYWNYKGINYR